MSGHSKFANIKHKKERNDAAKGKIFTIIGREIANNPDLLIAVQPTRGLDVGAIEYVHKMLIRERDKGKAILLISLELDEILTLFGFSYSKEEFYKLAEGTHDLFKEE